MTKVLALTLLLLSGCGANSHPLVGKPWNLPGGFISFGSDGVLNSLQYGCQESASWNSEDTGLTGVVRYTMTASSCNPKIVGWSGAMRYAIDGDDLTLEGW